MKLLKILVFFRKFLKDSDGFPFIFFEILQQWFLKNLKEPPFTVFGIVINFKINNFCLKI